MAEPPDRDPEQALACGSWVKIIAGASNQDLESIEDLAGIYALARVHCIDVAADPAVVAATRRGVDRARRHHQALAGGSLPWRPPWLMVSLSDGEDPHFRKAWFDPRRCPPSCPRPCARVCPALAIPSPPASNSNAMGVLAERCYGCGRCLPVCPLGLIEERWQVLPSEAVAPLLTTLQPDAVELHTRMGRDGAFRERVDQLLEAGLPLRRVSVSCSRSGEHDLTGELWKRFRVLSRVGYRPLWQLDGRPMSGDVGAGTAHAALALLQDCGDRLPPGPIQLAGGTNHHTLELLRRGERRDPARQGGGTAAVAGVAFGGVARRLLQPFLLEAHRRQSRLLDEPDLWPRALALALDLVGPWLHRSLESPG